MTTGQELPRDVFIEAIRQESAHNKEIYFMSADLGAKALDRFRVEANAQFIHAGICEQNMIDVAAGLALNGKTVYVYAMAPFVTLRCYEQIKVAIASMDLPLTIIGVGVGYGYDDAGPTHYATEDVSCMRALGGIEIITPCDTESVLATAKLTYSQPALRYVRLDRVFLPPVYMPGETKFLSQGMVEVEQGRDVCIITAGYMIRKALEVKKKLVSLNIHAGVIDLYRLKPLNLEILKSIVMRYSRIVTLEEHFLSGGLGGAIAEGCFDADLRKPVLRLGIPDHYHFENGGREYLHHLAGLDVATVTDRVAHFCQKSGE
ncbi:transketolase family protein [Candidatus Nitrospira salsa]|nr:MAG: transketolase [Nitrospirales bacterium]